MEWSYGILPPVKGISFILRESFQGWWRITECPEETSEITNFLASGSVPEWDLNIGSKVSGRFRSVNKAPDIICRQLFVEITRCFTRHCFVH